MKSFEQNLANNCNAKPFWHYVKCKRKVRSVIGPVTKSSDGTLAKDVSST